MCGPASFGYFCSLCSCCFGCPCSGSGFSGILLALRRPVRLSYDRVADTYVDMKIGDHAAWGPRIAQGKDTLYKDAINGKGAMPPKGGTSWPDATIRMTVDYMVSLNSK